MSAHTKGRLKVASVCTDGSIGLVAESLPRCVFASVHNGPSIGDVLFGREPVEQWENARRLVAAWNAVDGIPTEDLESKVVVGFMADLKRQRDELIDALTKLANAHEEVCPSKAECATLKFARAAIAKHAPKAPA